MLTLSLVSIPELAQLNSQMRAALGLPANVDVNDVTLYLQAQRQQQDFQRDFQLRQMLLQEQLDQDFGGQRLRALEERLQHDYRSLLLSEQFQHQQQRSHHEQVYLREHAAAAAAQQAAAAQAQLNLYQDEMRRQQLGFRPDDMAQPATSYNLGNVSAPGNATTASIHLPPGATLQLSSNGTLISSSDAAALAQMHLQHQQQQHQNQQAVATHQHAAHQALQQHQLRELEEENSSGAIIGELIKKRSYSYESVTSGGSDVSEPLGPPPPKRRPEVVVEGKLKAKPRKKQERKSKAAPTQRKSPSPVQASLPLSAPALPLTKKELKAQQKLQKQKMRELKQKTPKFQPKVSQKNQAPKQAKRKKQRREKYIEDDMSEESRDAGVLDTLASAGEARADQFTGLRKGTFEEILAAAIDKDQLDGAAAALRALASVEWREAEEGKKEEDFEKSLMEGLKPVIKPAEIIITSTFKSVLPALPSEPMFTEAMKYLEEMRIDGSGDQRHAREDLGKTRACSVVSAKASSPPEEKAPASKRVSNVLEPSSTADAWWPSTSGVRRERRQEGEASDEDDFDESISSEAQPSKFRANRQMIQKRLTTSVEPGFLEKLPPCKLHRVRTKNKKNPSAQTEMAYCFQVSELYPKDIMLNCSVCGTWRHAACGGHFEAYSTRKNADQPFVPICENCHEEEKFLKEYPKGGQRLERQRLEQLRRALTSSAVMRHFSFSKHSGTCKWPLGSVSSTHMGGHMRSVHSRHDKAEKQWGDMVSRLGRGYGYRPKERVRVRTKELERLLVAVEDAESYSDRHNMLLFLMRDTARDAPIGYENEPKNLLDPADDDAVADENEESKTENDTAVDASQLPTCARSGCFRRRRFDSIFCSDGCGVLALEVDLMRAIQEAGDIHPSALRHT